MRRLGNPSLEEVVLAVFQRTFQGLKENGMTGYASDIVSMTVPEVGVWACGLTTKQNVNHSLQAFG